MSMEIGIHPYSDTIHVKSSFPVLCEYPLHVIGSKTIEKKTHIYIKKTHIYKKKKKKK